jgi:hypothetical protein
MKKYSIFQAPYLAFYSSDFYRDAGLNWSGTGFGYLFLLLFVCLIPKAAQLQLSLNDFAKNEAPALITQVPEIKIVNGEVSATVPQPYTITDPQSRKPIAIVDTTGATVSLEGSGAFLLIRKTEVIVKPTDLDTRTVSFKEIKSFTLNQDGLNYVLGLVRGYGVMLFSVVALFGAYIFRMAQALIYAALGLGLASLLGVSVPYGTLLRLSVMAITPVILVSTAAEVAGLNIPHPWLLCFAAAMGFLFFGLKAIAGRQEPAAPVRDDQYPAGPQGA